MSYIEELERRCTSLEGKVFLLQKQTEEMPAGRLRCKKDGDSYKWFNIQDGSPVYISRKKAEIAQKLALKGYRLQIIEDMQAEINCIRKFTRVYTKLNLPHGRKYLDKGQEYKRLVEEAVNFSSDPVVSAFVNRKYKGGPYQERCTLKCLSGHMVRTKAENQIADMLYMMGVPFLYEYPWEVEIGGRVVIIHPDFTIMNPVTHEIFIWEHMGRMDSKSYASNTDSRIAQLCSIGFFPDDKLILTFEGGNHRLSTAEIEAKIFQFFPELV